MEQKKREELLTKLAVEVVEWDAGAPASRIAASPELREAIRLWSDRISDCCVPITHTAIQNIVRKTLAKTTAGRLCLLFLRNQTVSADRFGPGPHSHMVLS